MLQRSPTYVVSRPGRDPLSEWLHGKLPDTLTYRINRWKNWSLQQLMFNISRRFPAQIKDWMVAQVRAEIGDAAEPHFRPHYDPWTQRVCVVPDGDLFHAINDGRASVVTDEVATFTETGLELKSGDVLDADLIVTATGLHIQFFGGAEMVVDGEVVDLADTMAYRSMMLSGVPNMAFTVGYTNASWTLKVDLTCEYVTRVLRHMSEHGHDICLPVLDPSVAEAPPASPRRRAALLLATHNRASARAVAEEVDALTAGGVDVRVLVEDGADSNVDGGGQRDHPVQLVGGVDPIQRGRRMHSGRGGASAAAARANPCGGAAARPTRARSARHCDGTAPGRARGACCERWGAASLEAARRGAMRGGRRGPTAVRAFRGLGGGPGAGGASGAARDTQAQAAGGWRGKR